MSRSAANDRQESAEVERGLKHMAERVRTIENDVNAMMDRIGLFEKVVLLR